MTGSAAESAPDGIAPERVGWFRFYFDEQRWEWSPEVERLHGHNPGTVTPTTARQARTAVGRGAGVCAGPS